EVLLVGADELADLGGAPGLAQLGRDRFGELLERAAFLLGPLPERGVERAADADAESLSAAWLRAVGAMSHCLRGARRAIVLMVHRDPSIGSMGQRSSARAPSWGKLLTAARSCRSNA